MLREPSRGRLRSTERQTSSLSRQNSGLSGRQPEDDTGARLIYRADSAKQLDRVNTDMRFERQDSVKTLGSMKNLSSSGHYEKDKDMRHLSRGNSHTNFERSNTRDRLPRLDSHIQQRTVTRNSTRQNLVTRNSTRQNLGSCLENASLRNQLSRGNSKYELIREPSSGQLQRGNSRAGFFRESFILFI